MSSYYPSFPGLYTSRSSSLPGDSASSLASFSESRYWRSFSSYSLSHSSRVSHVTFDPIKPHHLALATGTRVKTLNTSSFSLTLVIDDLLSSTLI
jgi:hypothetical protein